MHSTPLRILVTGAAGFIGRHLVPELERGGHTVITTDHGDELLEVDENIDLTRRGDVISLFDRVRPQVVVHLAAQVGRMFGEDVPRHTIEANAAMTAHVAQAAACTKARVVYASTSEVYGDRGYDTCEEGMLVGDQLNLPHNLYGMSKLWGEQACRLYAPDELQILRISMPYGPGVPPGRGRAAINNFLWQAATGQRIPVHSGAERSWVWIGDLVKGIRLVIEHGQRNAFPGSTSGIYNIGRDDDARPMREIARMACDIALAPHSLIDVVPAPGMQTVVKRLSTDKLRRLGWTPAVGLDDGMRRVYAYVSKFNADGLKVGVEATTA